MRGIHNFPVKNKSPIIKRSCYSANKRSNVVRSNVVVVVAAAAFMIS